VFAAALHLPREELSNKPGLPDRKRPCFTNTCNLNIGVEIFNSSGTTEEKG
jgi:hypothetical protein